jgi:hypothetical protein
MRVVSCPLLASLVHVFFWNVRCTGDTLQTRYVKWHHGQQETGSPLASALRGCFSTPKLATVHRHGAIVASAIPLGHRLHKANQCATVTDDRGILGSDECGHRNGDGMSSTFINGGTPGGGEDRGNGNLGRVDREVM